VDYRDRHVVVTGGTGALGSALVGALIAGGAICHVPALSERRRSGSRTATIRR
jgi:NAD(P)-dependent dehydrogenase (short-subunit alcohol dehydrogenase family)